MKNNLKYHITTFGCQMNKSDSERIDGLLLDMGFKAVDRAEDADLIILNTCSVRQTAEDRIYGLMRNLTFLKKKKPHLLIGVTGCMAGRDKDGKIKERLSSANRQGKRNGLLADFVFNISDLPRLPEIISSRWHTAIGFTTPTSKEMDYLGVKPKAKEWWRGCVVIQTGCSNYCAYCVVPFARGHEKNRPVCEILKEAREMASSGAKEIILLGQAVNGYIAPDPQNFSKTNPFTVGHSATYSDLRRFCGK